MKQTTVIIDSHNLEHTFKYTLVVCSVLCAVCCVLWANIHGNIHLNTHLRWQARIRKCQHCCLSKRPLAHLICRLFITASCCHLQAVQPCWASGGSLNQPRQQSIALCSLSSHILELERPTINSIGARLQQSPLTATSPVRQNLLPK